MVLKSSSVASGWPTPIKTTSAHRYIHSGPYDVGRSTKGDHGRNGLPGNALGATTRGFAPWYASVHPCAPYRKTSSAVSGYTRSSATPNSTGKTKITDFDTRQRHSTRNPAQ